MPNSLSSTTLLTRNFDSQDLFHYHRAPMSEQASVKRLPKVVEPRKLVATGATFKREIDLSDLRRLREAVISADYVKVDLRFERDEQGRPQMVGKIDACLNLECQRCLNPMDLTLALATRLSIVWDEAQAQALPKDVDPWIVDGVEADLCAIVEEEILLSLPVVPKHENDCLDASAYRSGSEPDELEKTKSPFDVLAGLKGE